MFEKEIRTGFKLLTLCLLFLSLVVIFLYGMVVLKVDATLEFPTNDFVDFVADKEHPHAVINWGLLSEYEDTSGDMAAATDVSIFIPYHPYFVGVKDTTDSYLEFTDNGGANIITYSFEDDEFVFGWRTFDIPALAYNMVIFLQSNGLSEGQVNAEKTYFNDNSFVGFDFPVYLLSDLEFDPEEVYDIGKAAGITAYHTGTDYGLYDVEDSAAWDLGYADGIGAGIGADFLSADFLMGIFFSTIGGIAEIELLPNLTIGMLIAVPLILGLMAFFIGVATMSVSVANRQSVERPRSGSGNHPQQKGVGP